MDLFMELPMTIKTKCVFNSSALGKQYSAKGMLERCNGPQETLVQKHDLGKGPSSKIIPPNEQIPACSLTK